MISDSHNLKQKPAPYLRNQKWEQAANWTRCHFDPTNLADVHAWIKENVKGKYSLSITSVRFEDLLEATYFMLAYQNGN